MIGKIEAELINLLVYIVGLIVVYSVYIGTSDAIAGTVIAIFCATAVYYGINQQKDRNNSISMSIIQKKFRIVPLMFLVSITIIIKYALSTTFTFGTSGNQERILEEMENVPIHETFLNYVIKSPIVEEIIFRGLVLLICFTMVKLLLNRVEVTEQSKNKIAVVIFLIVSATSFGLAHMTEDDKMVQLLPYMVSGLVFACIYIVTQNIITAMIVHGVGNFTATLSGLNKVGLIAFDFSVYVFIGICAVIIVLLFIMWVQYLDYIADYKDENKEITSLMKDEIFAKIMFG
jgi:membrane protease YdiL (CAAX protease family)